MANYEVMYIVKPMEEKAFEVVVAKMNDVITTNGGTVDKTERWGKKHLAYQLEDFDEGMYVLVTFTGMPHTVKELDRKMLITDEVLRHMIVRKDTVIPC